MGVAEGALCLGWENFPWRKSLQPTIQPEAASQGMCVPLQGEEGLGTLSWSLG